MVVGAFPAIKLAVLLFKQISKPLANFAKERAKHNRFFRTYVCMPPAHFYNWCEVQSKMWIMNLGKPVNIPHLNEQMAIELGANLLGEGIIFILGAVVVIMEYNRSSKKEEKKEEMRVAEITQMNSVINELYFTVQKQDTQIRELHRELYDLEQRAIVKPWGNKKLKDDEEPLTPPPPPSSGSLPIKKPVSFNESINNQESSTPYPDRGVINKSLNYLELTVLNTPQIENIKKESPDTQLYTKKINLIDDALSYIKNDIKAIL